MLSLLRLLVGFFVLRLDEHAHEFIGEERDMKVLLVHPDGTPVIGQQNKQTEVEICACAGAGLRVKMRG